MENNTLLVSEWKGFLDASEGTLYVYLPTYLVTTCWGLPAARRAEERVHCLEKTGSTVTLLHRVYSVRMRNTRVAF